MRSVIALVLLAGAVMAQEPVDLPPVEGTKIPAGLRYGPYTHLVPSREKEALSRSVKKVLHDLQDVFYTCTTCTGEGTIEVTVRAGYWLDECTWVPPLTESRTCPACEGSKSLFNRDVGTRVFRRLTPATNDDDAYMEAQERWLKRLYQAKKSLNTAPRYSIAMDGCNAAVSGRGGAPLYPIRFRLVPAGKKYKWALHDPALHGPFRPDNGIGKTGKIEEVAAADVYVLEGGAVVRLCGIYVPYANGKAPPPDLPKANEAVRKVVAAELKGKTVRLERDPRAAVTCDGHPLVYVVLNDKDYGAELLRRGLVRRHGGHKHARNHGYMKTETAARKAKVGIWK